MKPLDQTFPRRRQDIGGSRGRWNKSIEKLRDNYPALFEKEESEKYIVLWDNVILILILKIR